jgi:hypothetical protein
LRANKELWQTKDGSSSKVIIKGYKIWQMKRRRILGEQGRDSVKWKLNRNVKDGKLSRH